MVEALSRELRLVAACALVEDEMLAERAEALCRAGLDWARVRALARHHEVLAMAGGRLEKLAPGLLPADLAALARVEQTRILALQTAQAHHTARLVSTLAARGVRTIVLKGAPLARMLYPDSPHWRYSSDIDVLIDPGDLGAADEALRACGHARTWPEPAMAARLAPELIARFAKDYQYVGADGAHHVELHFRLTLNPHVLSFSFGELYDRTVAIDTGFGEVRALEGPVLLGYLAWHAFAGIGHALKWFADVAWTRRRLAMLGVATGLDDVPARVPARALALAGQVEARLLGERAAGDSAPVRRICREMDRARPAQSARSFERLPREMAFAALQLRLAEGACARAYVLWRAVVDPRDAMTLGGRSLPSIVYALAGPALAFWRLMRRSGGGNAD